MSESASRFHGKRLSGVPASDWPPITAEQWRAPVRFDVPPRRTLTGRVVRWAASLCFREDPTLRRHCTCTVKWAPHGARTKYIMVMGTTDRRAAESRALAATR